MSEGKALVVGINGVIMVLAAFWTCHYGSPWAACSLGVMGSCMVTLVFS